MGCRNSKVCGTLSHACIQSSDVYMVRYRIQSGQFCCTPAISGVDSICSWLYQSCRHVDSPYVAQLFELTLCCVHLVCCEQFSDTQHLWSCVGKTKKKYDTRSSWQLATFSSPAAAIYTVCKSILHNCSTKSVGISWCRHPSNNLSNTYYDSITHTQHLYDQCAGSLTSELVSDHMCCVQIVQSAGRVVGQGGRPSSNHNFTGCKRHPSHLLIEQDQAKTAWDR